MSERIGHERIRRESGYLYFLGKDGYVWRMPMKMNPSGRKARVSKEKFEREPGYMYFLDKGGYVARAKVEIADVSPSEEQVTYSSLPHSPFAKLCPDCRAEVDLSHSFCWRCGRPLSGTIPHKCPPAKGGNKRLKSK